MKILKKNSPSQYRGAIFDLDGTLLNTIDDLADSVNETMAAMRYPTFSTEEVMKLVGSGFRNLITRALPEAHRSEEKIALGLRLFDEAYSRNYARKTAPYPGIPELIRTLAGRGICLAVDSNKRDDYTNILIRKWFPDIPFTGVYGEREKDGIPKKPHPAAALTLASRMKLLPEKVLFVGDSRPDMETGRNAGMDCAGVTWGFRAAKELEENGAAYLIENPEELLALLPAVKK
ncbi:MAG: HAD family hydrolase [Lachnospiraceae bacterium]|nr:HAD family hydrolase [Lachnospiraceae bacterium]